MQTTGGRIPPALPPAAFKTYLISAPLATHYRTGISCREFECDAYLRGWTSVIDERTELGQRQAHYIRKVSGRKFTEDRDDAGLTVFRFEPGQEGFAGGEDGHQDHRRRLDRLEHYVERGGDWRGNPTGMRRVHKRPADWVDSFQDNQDRIKTLQERG